MGAGPTGLTLAICLQRQGVQCRVVEQLDAPSFPSRALGLHARSLEIFAALGVLDAIEAVSRKVTTMAVHSDDGPLFSLDFSKLDSPTPYVLSCPQGQLESLLADHFVSLGGQLQRSTTLLDFSQDGQQVRVRLRHQADSSSSDNADIISTTAVRLMVGADGVDSTVREQLGIEFRGVEYAEHFLLADVPGTGWKAPWSDDAAQGFLLEDGLLLAQPMPQGWRLIMSLTSAPQPPLTMRPFEQRLATLFGQTVTLPEPQWLSQFTVQRRLAQHYRRNRVFLVGDAAHVQSPLASQGMNTGIADAFNLGWKFALYLQGDGGGRLLDSYEQERRPVAENILRGSDLFSRALLLKQPLLRRSRNSLLRFGATRPALEQRLLRAASQLNVHYRSSPLVGCGPLSEPRWRDEGPRPGDRMLDARLISLRTSREQTVHGLLMQPVHHVLLQLGERPEHEARLVMFALADRLGQDFDNRVHFTVVASGKTPAEQVPREGIVRVWQDLHGDFERAYGAEAGLWLMRPDGHLGYRAKLSNANQLLAFLDELGVSA